MSIRSGVPTSGASHSDPCGIAQFMIAGDTLCRAHAEDEIRERARAYATMVGK